MKSLSLAGVLIYDLGTCIIFTLSSVQFSRCLSILIPTSGCSNAQELISGSIFLRFDSRLHGLTMETYVLITHTCPYACPHLCFHVKHLMFRDVHDSMHAGRLWTTYVLGIIYLLPYVKN